MAEEGSAVGYLMPNLSEATPATFIHNLKQAYVDGKGKAGIKFQVLRQQVTKALPTAPPPGPATFVVHCIEVLLSMEPPFNEGLTHLLTWSLNHLSTEERLETDASCARKLASQLFVKAVAGGARLDSRVVVRIALVFQIQLLDIGQVMIEDSTDEEKIKKGRATVEPFIRNLVDEKSYTSAVALLKQFDLHDCTPQEFLVSMVTHGQPDAAGQWAAHLGKDMCCYLVQQCTALGLHKIAYKLVERYNLGKIFPDAYQLYRQSSIRKLVAKGLWDVAESIAVQAHLEEYLVSLASEKGCTSEVAGLCQRSQLEHAACESVQKEDEAGRPLYVQLSDIMSLENLYFVDSAEGLASAADHFKDVTIIGIDCEWKANREKGGKENKVSILQVATAEKAFVFDLIVLSEKEPEALDSCIMLIFHNSTILKLGYAVTNDLKNLLQSYRNLDCFGRCESVLDLQTYAGATMKGGLSGLTKVALGKSLDKRKRMSDWEQRPLSTEQLHYAALDAAVLLSIFGYLSARSETGSNEAIQDWKSLVISFRSAWKERTSLDCSVEKRSQTIGNDEASSSRDRYQASLSVREDSPLLTSSEPGTEASSSSEREKPQIKEEDDIPTLISGASSWEPVDNSRVGRRDSEKGGVGGLGNGDNSVAPDPSFRDGGPTNILARNDTIEVDLTEGQCAAEDEVQPRVGTNVTVLPAMGNINLLTEEMAALVHSRQDSVVTSFEDVPTPGLLKDELEAVAHAAGLPAPLYRAVSWGPKRRLLFCCIIRVAGVHILGGPTYRKRDAEFLAVQAALYYFASGQQNVQALRERSPHRVWGGCIPVDPEMTIHEVAEKFRHALQVRVGVVEPELCIFSAVDQACKNQRVCMRGVRNNAEEGDSTRGCSCSARRRNRQTDASSRQWGRGVIISASSPPNQLLPLPKSLASKFSVLHALNDNRTTRRLLCGLSRQLSSRFIMTGIRPAFYRNSL